MQVFQNFSNYLSQAIFIYRDMQERKTIRQALLSSYLDGMLAEGVASCPYIAYMRP